MADPAVKKPEDTKPSAASGNRDLAEGMMDGFEGDDNYDDDIDFDGLMPGEGGGNRPPIRNVGENSALADSSYMRVLDIGEVNRMNDEIDNDIMNPELDDMDDVFADADEPETAKGEGNTGGAEEPDDDVSVPSADDLEDPVDTGSPDAGAQVHDEDDFVTRKPLTASNVNPVMEQHDPEADKALIYGNRQVISVEPGGITGSSSDDISVQRQSSSYFPSQQRSNVARKMDSHKDGYLADKRNKAILEKSDELNKEISEILALVKEVNMNIVDTLAKVNATSGQLRKEYNGIQKLTMGLDIQLEKSNNFFSDRYLDNLHKSAERMLSQYIDTSRNQYMDLFQSAVKNYKEFSSAAMKFQKSMESRISKEFRFLVRMVCIGIPVLIVLNMIMIGLFVWKFLLH